MAQYKIKVVPVLDTASLKNQLDKAGAKGSVKAGATTGGAYANGFGRAIKERFKYSIANALIYGTEAAFKDMVQNVRELDAAQTELKKVSDLSGKSLEVYTEKAYTLGRTVAKTGTEMIQAATEFKKQGFDAETSLQLSEIASQFQNIADTEISAADASKFINSQLKAFGNVGAFKNLNTDAEKATRVIDAVNEVANNFGVGTNDLQMALTKTAAAMKGYGNSFEETIGIITAGTELMPNQASKVARGWRSIGANIVKLAQDTDRLETSNGKISVSLKDQNGNLKSTYQILQDLYPQWKKLDPIADKAERSELALKLAGKTQTEVFQSTMDNFEHAMGAYNTAMGAEGSAARENARYLDSIQGKIQNFQSAWEQLSYHIIDSDALKGVVDFGTTLITTLDNIIQKVGVLPTALGGVGLAIEGMRIFGGKNDFKGFIGFLDKISSFAGGTSRNAVASGIESTSTALSTLYTTVSVSGMRGADALDDMVDEFDEIRRAAVDVDFDTIVDGVDDFAEGATEAAGGAGLLSGGLSGMVPTLLTVAGVVAALGTAFYIAHEQYKNSFRGKLDSYHAIGEEIQGIKDEIDALTNKEGELTKEEETRLSILKMQLNILEKQEKLRLKEATEAFNKEAEKKFSKKPGLASDSQNLVGDSYLKVLQKRLNIEQQIQHLEDEARKHPLTSEQEKELEKLTKAYDETISAESDWLDTLAKEHELLADLDYNELETAGKAWYDNTHSAYLQAATDIQEVRDGIANTIDLFGSGQFDSWNIDVSSLKSASDLADQITTKISEMGDDEEVVIYARDEAGNIIDEVTKKKGELTEDEWELVVNATTTGNYEELQNYIDNHPDREEVLIEFKESGAQNVEEKKKKAAKNETAYVNVKDKGTARVKKTVKDAAKKRDAIIQLEDKGAPQVRKTKEDLSKSKTAIINIVQSGASAVKSAIDGIKGKNVFINIYKKIFGGGSKDGPGNATGKRKGEKGGMAWLGDEGSSQNPKPELVVRQDGSAYLAGTTGWEMHDIASTDTVYTHAQTKKLLGNKQSFIGAVGELPMYKKGKKATKKKTTKKASKPQSAKDKYDSAKKAYDKAKKGKNKKKIKKAKKALDKAKKALDNKRSAFDSDLETLKYQAEVNDWTEAKFQEEYAKLVGNYGNNLSTEQVRAFKEEQDKYNDALARKDAERLVSLVGVGAQTAASVVNAINNKSHLTADEKKDYKAQAYKASVEYNLKEYQNGKKTRDQILADIKNYYNTRGQYDDDYYKMLDDLREADKKKELDRLNELQDKEESKLNYLKKYAQRQKDYYDDQIKKEKEEADELEKLTDLQDKLNNAKKTMIKVYREGVGFVYEQDVEAIKDAQKALDEYNKAQEESELEKQAEEWQKILDLIGDLEDLSDMKELELKLGIGGITDLTGGDIGTDLNKWSEIVKNILATSQGYAEIIKLLDKASGADIENLIGTTLLDGEKTVSLDMILEYIKRHSFASGSLNTPSGLSLIGENGPEIGWLNKGSTIFSNSISKNLMDWGQYTPAQILEKSLGSTQSQVFNFDKIVLPNVRNADDFYKELQLLPNKAIQQSALRM